MRKFSRIAAGVVVAIPLLSSPCWAQATDDPELLFVGHPAAPNTPGGGGGGSAGSPPTEQPLPNQPSAPLPVCCFLPPPPPGALGPIEPAASPE